MWILFKINYFKINFDNFKDETGRVGVGYCVRDNLGKIRAVIFMICDNNFILVTEVIVYSGSRGNSFQRRRKVNICVIKILIKKWRIPQKIDSIIEDMIKDF